MHLLGYHFWKSYYNLFVYFSYILSGEDQYVTRGHGQTHHEGNQIRGCGAALIQQSTYVPVTKSFMVANFLQVWRRADFTDRSCDSAVGTQTRLLPRRWSNCASITGTRNRSFSSPRRLYRQWLPPSVLTGTGGESARACNWPLTLPSTAEVKN